MTAAQHLGKWLKRAREDAGLTQMEAGERLGVSRATITRIEKSARPKVDAAFLQRMSDAYGIPLDTLIRRLLGDDSGKAAAPSVGQVTFFDEKEREPGAPATGLSQKLRIWLQEFLLELAKAGASEHEIESARKALTSPEMFEFYHGGRSRSLTEDELMIEMEAVATGIRKVLRMRGRNITES